MEILQYPLNLVQLQRKRLQLKKQLAARSDVQWMDKRIAVLGGSTTHDIITYLELFLLNTGIRPEFYESEYGMFFEDAVFGNETLTNFKPDIVLIHTSTDNIRAWPGLDATEEDVNYL